jgi:hypothetical protein
MPHTDQPSSRPLERGIPAFPGASTPTEVLSRWRSGASAVKLFPASVVGPGFVREMRGPLPEIPLIPTGGVTIETGRRSSPPARSRSDRKLADRRRRSSRDRRTWRPARRGTRRGASLSEHQASAARSRSHSPSGPAAGDAERFATERGLRIEVETSRTWPPPALRVARAEPGSPKATTAMSERRWNPVLGEWTITATHRQDRTFLPPPDYCPLPYPTGRADRDRSIRLRDRRLRQPVSLTHPRPTDLRPSPAPT